MMMAHQVHKKRNLHRDLKYFLVMSQCFGIFPVLGIGEDAPKHLMFKWKAKRVSYAIVLLCGIGFLVCLNFFRICYTGIDLNRTSNCIFFLNGFLISYLFLQLSRRWPKFMDYWDSVEVSINNYGYTRALSRKFCTVSSITLGLALVEHCLFIATSYTNAKMDRENGTLKEILYHISIYDDAFVFDYIPYSLYLGLIIKVINFISTFYWNFADVFIILVSIALSAKFNQVNSRIKTAYNLRVNCREFWMHIRLDFDKLCRLCLRLDAEMAEIILISFGNNLYFIVIQLYGSLNMRSTFLESVYFFFSFSLMLLRTMSVALFAAQVNDASKQSLPYLNAICSEYYNEEIDRLISQMSTNTVALSGKRLFYITRGLVVSIAGTIVTYELFLLQFTMNRTLTLTAAP